MASEEPKLRTFSHFPAVLRIDGIDVRVRIKRMTNTEFDAFEAGFGDWAGAARGSTEESSEARAEREARTVAWMRTVLDEYFAIVPGEWTHDGREVTKGGDLLDICGGRSRQDVAPQAIALIRIENALRESEKKTSKSRLVSELGLATAPQSTAIGDGPDSSVSDAEPKASVPNAAATAPSSVALSGTTGRSPSGRVRSSRSRQRSSARSAGSIGPSRL